MSDLPEIKFKKKKERKGFLPWLREKLGLGPAGSMGQAASRAPNMVNLGRALGTAKITGTSTGFLGGLLAGKGALVATAALVAAAVGAGLYMANQPSTVERASSAFSSKDKKAEHYVPAIEREGQKGSSLDLFVKTNEGKWPKAGEEAAGAEDETENAEEAAAEESEAEEPQPQEDNMAQEMMAKLQAGSIGDLTSSLGGGSNKFSALGGFGNKFGSGQFGPKVGFSNNIGSGFQNLPGFQKRKKMLAMKGGKRALVSKIGSGKKGAYGHGAYNQAKGVRKTQKSYYGTSIDSLKGTQDKAWEGTTEGGTVSGGGSGISDGGGQAGVVTSPSLDSGGAAGGGNDYDNTTVPDVPTNPPDVSPWASLVSQSMIFIMLSAVLSAIGGKLIKMGYATSPIGWGLVAAGIALCVAAIGLAMIALMNGIKIMTEHGQTMLGMIYVIGAGCAIAAAFMAMAAVFNMVALFNPMWMGAIAAILAMLGSMMNTPVGGNTDNITGDDNQAYIQQHYGGNNNFIRYYG